MEHLETMRPFIRVAHQYRFPTEQHSSETGRIGYCYAFHLVDSGKAQISIPNHTFAAKKGDLIYFPPKLPHSFYPDPVHRLSTYNIYFELWTDTPLKTEQHLARNESEFDPNLLTISLTDTELNELPHVFPIQHDGAMIDLFTHIVAQHQKDEVYSTTIASSLLKAFILEIIQIRKHHLDLDDFRIKRLVQKIEAEADGEFHYEEWLKMSGLQKTQFHALFKRTTGVSPKAYWTKVLMKRAAATLWESNRSVTEIAADLGYSSIHHFTRQFTAFYGISPSQYRKRRN